MDGLIGKNYLKNYIQRAKPILKSFLDTEIEVVKRDDFGELPVRLLQDYSEMVSEGKGIRGALIELGYKAFGGTEEEKILNASIFIELFHSAILIQDDFMDRDDTRRGLMTIHKKYAGLADEYKVRTSASHFGNSIATCISDSGFYYSWKVLLNSKFSPELILKAGDLYSHYIARLGLGQALDVALSASKVFTQEELLKVLYFKTVEYTSILPLKVGAALAGSTDEEGASFARKLAALEEYAKCLGWAFQIQDDILGLFAEEVELGKPVGSDVREGKNTLLMIELQKIGTQDQKDFQKKVLGNSEITKEDVDKIKQMVKESGAYQKVMDLGWNYVNEGKKYIAEITTDKEIADTLESLIVYMMERTK